MTDLCGEFGVSRKTGHKIWDRYKQKGPAGLEDESRAPKRIANKTDPAIVERLVELRKKHPSWGGRKMRDWLCENEASTPWPAPSTMTDIFRRNGLLDPSGRRSLSHRRRPGTAWSTLKQAEQPNDVWCVDYKGQFRLGNHQYCYPLTTSDLSRSPVALTQAAHAGRDTLAATATAHGHAGRHSRGAFGNLRGLRRNATSVVQRSDRKEGIRIGQPKKEAEGCERPPTLRPGGFVRAARRR